MDYFEHFGLKQIFNLDLALLRRQFYLKSKESHPDIVNDHNIHNSSVSSYNNEAYRILSNPLFRLKYILHLKFGPDLNEPKPNTAFLMEMLDFHEKIDFAISKNNPTEINILKKALDDLFLIEEKKVKEYLERFDAGDNSNEVYQKMLDYYTKLKYFDRLFNNLNNKENEL
ncbi:MAG: Fe-S protein assembly co-chaperone HscB [Saprospiraceae bacterium]|nr:Fe-S protein assembly co-chaperone HscB [Candidatus Vicinibacter affinis]MBK7692989.1 Fe-S protein assembly co-chaperone HscB [Candidatus Vicinibacter affinis]